MRDDPIEILDAFYAVWLRRDLPGVMSFLSPMFRITQHFEDPALPFTGTTVGKAAFEERMQQIYDDWEFLRAEHKHVLVDGERVRTRVKVDLQHKATGEIFDGTLLHHWVVRDGLLAHLDEHIDVARLKAFLRLLGLPSDR